MPGSVGSRRRWHILAYATILILALGLRFYHINYQSLWNDEGTSVALARRSLDQITVGAARDIHPPLYYYLLHLWIKLWGTSEAAVRSLSALLGLTLVAIIHQIGKHLFGDEVALLAALFAAVSPYQIYYSQETRMYMLLCSIGALSTLAFVQLLIRWASTDGAKGRWRLSTIALYLAASIAAIYSHYMGFTVILAQNLIFLVWLATEIRRAKMPDQKQGTPSAVLWAIIWSRVWPWVLVQIAIIISYVPWLLLSWNSLNAWPSVSEPLTLGYLLGETARMFSFGVTVPLRQRFLWLGVSLSGLAAVGALWPSLVGYPESDMEPPSPRLPRYLGTLLCLIYALTPIIFIYIVSLSRPMYKPKFMLVAIPPFLILQAWGILAIGRLALRAARWLQIAVIALLVCAVLAGAVRGLYGVYGDPHFARDDYRGIAAYIDASAGPNDAIMINAPAQIETFDYYYSGPLPEYPLPRSRPLTPTLTENELTEIIAHHERVYAVYWATDESDPEGLIESWLDARCYKAVDSWFGNVRLVVYAVPQPGDLSTREDVRVRFGDHIILTGYAISGEEFVSGNILQLALYWQAAGEIEQRYKVFAHLIDDRNQIVAQRDSEPGGGNKPTNAWQPDEEVSDNHGILIPHGTLPGPHTLRIGMYDPETGQRLGVSDESSTLGDDRSVLDAFELEAIPIHLATVSPPIGAFDMQTRDGIQFGIVELVGHSLNRLGFDHAPDTPIRPGDTISIVYVWRRSELGAIPEKVHLSLEKRGNVQWRGTQSLAGGVVSEKNWPLEQIIRDKQQFTLPANLAPGTYRLSLNLSGGEDTHTVQKLILHAP